jgi:hypothetical protein
MSTEPSRLGGALESTGIREVDLLILDDQK